MLRYIHACIHTYIPSFHTPCMYVCMYAYVCLCMPMYVDVCRCMSMYVYICLCMPMYAYVCLCMSMYVCMYVCLSIYLSIYLSMYVCMYVCMNLSLSFSPSPSRQVRLPEAEAIMRSPKTEATSWLNACMWRIELKNENPNRNCTGNKRCSLRNELVPQIGLQA